MEAVASSMYNWTRDPGALLGAKMAIGAAMAMIRAMGRDSWGLLCGGFGGRRCGRGGQDRQSAAEGEVIRNTVGGAVGAD